mmetsp:Transcript_20916/g.43723  ORF Transcript_20916/g.43723 Transcript_20916/m.43723 type:complete len:106 (-) Transcript_20916:662-979(-)
MTMSIIPETGLCVARETNPTTTSRSLRVCPFRRVFADKASILRPPRMMALEWIIIVVQTNRNLKGNQGHLVFALVRLDQKAAVCCGLHLVLTAVLYFFFILLIGF